MQAIRVPLPLAALSLIAAVAVGMIAYHFAFSDANADSHDSAGEVRVATRSLDDGRVEVAVQQRPADADWSDRQLPDAHFLPADVEPNVWRVSSGVPISADASDGSLYSWSRTAIRRIASGASFAAMPASPPNVSA